MVMTTNQIRRILCSKDLVWSQPWNTIFKKIQYGYDHNIPFQKLRFFTFSMVVTTIATTTLLVAIVYYTLQYSRDHSVFVVATMRRLWPRNVPVLVLFWPISNMYLSTTLRHF